MEVNSGLVVGCQGENEVLLVIGRDAKYSVGASENGSICRICEDDVGVNIDGEVFVACHDCAFPICKTCYDYERSQGTQLCPQCNTRFKRLKGHARVEGDEEETGDMDDLEKELNYNVQQQLAQISCDTHHPTFLFPRQITTLRMDPYNNNNNNTLHPWMEGQFNQALCRKLPISSRKINPYRMIIIIRLVVVALFFHYRLTHPIHDDAYALWLISVLCEILFSLSWILNQFSKWFPVERETYLHNLSLRYDIEAGEGCELGAVDILVSLGDPLILKDHIDTPPLVTIANTVLSILAVDYPVDKVSCYVSDDGASMLTFEALCETYNFATKWVPFCKNHNNNNNNIEPRAPQLYFSHPLDYFNPHLVPSFVKERRAMKREYEEFLVRINSLVVKAGMAPDEGWTMQDGSLWPGNNVHDHPGIIQVIDLNGHDGNGRHENELPRLVYMAREKRSGFNHHGNSGAMNALVRVSGVVSNAPYLLKLDCGNYINNSKAIREAMCFMMDPQLGKRICYVQFPHPHNNVDTTCSNTDMKGLDGIQGPICVGTGCVFRRQALYGFHSPTTTTTTHGCWSTNTTTTKEASHTFGQSPVFVKSTTLLQDGGIPTGPTSPSLLNEAIHVATSSYEHKTKWGTEIGWIYGSVTEDMLTGFKMHCRGWRSVYCAPATPAFEGSTAMNLYDRLPQVFRLAVGSMEIFFSRHCPLWYGYGGGGLKWFQRLSYINAITYPWTSIPLLAYCTLPAICLMTGKFIIPEVGGVGSLWYAALFLCMLGSGMLEMRWSGVSIDEWWRNQQLWVIGGVSGHLLAVFHVMLKLLVGADHTNSIKWTTLVIPPAALLILNLIAIVLAISNAAINKAYQPLVPLLGKLFFAFWVIGHLYPVLKAVLGGRQNKSPTTIALVSSSILLASIFSLLWFHIDPFLSNTNGSSVLEECGLECN